ncbi:DNA polymerase III subunit delta' [Thermodesulfobacteriota bacterium]
MPFDALLGHARPVQTLRSMLRSGNVPHAFIFSGMEGIGKCTAAVSFAKALNCRELPDDFCDSCLSCQKIERRMHPDVFHTAPEKNVIKIEQVRALQQDIAFKPLEGDRKVVIIDRAEKLNPHAANCLLKTLEEPPSDTVLILVAQATTGLLPTVLSRCQKIVFSPLSTDEVVQLLGDGGIEAGRAADLARHARGSVQKALFLEESDFLSRRSELADMLAGDNDTVVDAALELAQRLSRESETIPLMLEFLLGWYRDLLVAKEGLADASLYNADIAEAVHAAARHESPASIKRKLRKIQWIQRNAVLNPDMQLGLESVLMGTA